MAIHNTTRAESKGAAPVSYTFIPQAQGKLNPAALDAHDRKRPRTNEGDDRRPPRLPNSRIHLSLSSHASHRPRRMAKAKELTVPTFERARIHVRTPSDGNRSSGDLLDFPTTRNRKQRHSELPAPDRRSSVDN